jgi:hypothetical protein
LVGGVLAKVYSAAVWGVDAYAVEVNARPGKPVTVIGELALTGEVVSVIIAYSLEQIKHH